MVYKPGVSPLELVNTKTITRVSQFFSTIKKQVRKNIKSNRLIKILEFPVLFLGAKPSNTPAFYNFMNYADFGLGTWHPRGGMYNVIDGMVSLAESLGVTFKTNVNVGVNYKVEDLKGGIDGAELSPTLDVPFRIKNR